MHAIEVHELRKSYDGVEAVRGISFEIGSGEVFGLLGPNGAGRRRRSRSSRATGGRTAARRPCSASIPALAGPDWRERIGVVPQSGELFPNLTVMEHLELFAGYYAKPSPPAEVLSLVGLEHKRDAKTRTLSGGQKRRLDLGIALVGDPELLFLDEPTTGFDPGARRAAWETIRSLRSLGKTILLTTHYIEEAQRLADRVAVMRAGRDRCGWDAGRADGRGAGQPDQLQAKWLRGRDRDRGADARPARADRRGAPRGLRARGARSASTDTRRRLPLAHGGDGVRLVLHQFRAEQRLFWRSRELAFFTFLLPIVFFLILGSAYGDEEIEGADGYLYLLSGMIGYGAAATAFAGLALLLVIRRESGVLKRLRATPAARVGVHHSGARVDRVRLLPGGARTHRPRPARVRRGPAGQRWSPSWPHSLSAPSPSLPSVSG